MMLLLSPMVATFLILFHQDHCCKAVCVYCVLALCCTYEYQRKTLTRVCTLQSSESWLISGATTVENWQTVVSYPRTQWRTVEGYFSIAYGEAHGGLQEVSR